MRIALKTAILATCGSQRAVAAITRIPENRLSSIVRGWVEPRPHERLALQHCLGIGPEAFATVEPEAAHHG